MVWWLYRLSIWKHVPHLGATSNSQNNNSWVELRGLNLARCGACPQLLALLVRRPFSLDGRLDGCRRPAIDPLY